MPAKLITFILLCLKVTQNLHQKKKKRKKDSAFWIQYTFFSPSFVSYPLQKNPDFLLDSSLILLGKYRDFLLIELAVLHAYSSFFYQLENTWPKLMMGFSFSVILKEQLKENPLPWTTAPQGVQGASSSAPGAPQQVKVAQTPARNCPPLSKSPLSLLFPSHSRLRHLFPSSPG